MLVREGVAGHASAYPLVYQRAAFESYGLKALPLRLYISRSRFKITLQSLTHQHLTIKDIATVLKESSPLK